MRLLDLFCGGGGAAAGYARAGFIVTGIDICAQNNYPFNFLQQDALQLTPEWICARFDVIHASPPCQAYTRKSAKWGRKRAYWYRHEDLLADTRKLLISTGLPYVIENVPGAPLRHDLMLCGTMFGLRIRKHRYFESNVDLPDAPGPCSHRDVYNPWQGKGRTAVLMREAMGIDWLPMAGGASRKHGYTGDLYNALPPAYTEHIGRHWRMNGSLAVVPDAVSFRLR